MEQRCEVDETDAVATEEEEESCDAKATSKKKETIDKRSTAALLSSRTNSNAQREVPQRQLLTRKKPYTHRQTQALIQPSRQSQPDKKADCLRYRQNQ